MPTTSGPETARDTAHNGNTATASGFTRTAP